MCRTPERRPGSAAKALRERNSLLYPLGLQTMLSCGFKLGWQRCHVSGSFSRFPKAESPLPSPVEQRGAVQI